MQMNKNKFNINEDKAKRTLDGIVFDSAIEMRYYQEVVKPCIEKGEIIVCERQKKYILQPAFKKDGKKILPIEYKADFYIKYSNGNERVIDIKGFADAQAKIKRKMFWFVYPDISYEWVSWSKIDGGWTTYDYVQKQRAERRKNKKETKE